MPIQPGVLARHGDWRPVVREVADKFLECGVLERGFARACATHGWATYIPGDDAKRRSSPVITELYTLSLCSPSSTEF